MRSANIAMVHVGVIPSIVVQFFPKQADLGITLIESVSKSEFKIFELGIN
jgi:hypothetical protein